MSKPPNLPMLVLAWLAVTGATAQGVDTAQQPEAAPLTLQELRTFTDVFEQLRGNYIEEIDDATLLRAAIRGMLAETDAFSTYLDPNEYRALKDSTRGTSGGIGATVAIRHARLFVEAVQPGSPADLAGIRPGDLITSVQGQRVRGRRLADALDTMRGEPGSELSLEVASPGQEARQLRLIRASVPVASISGEWLEPGFACVRISHFNQHSDSEFQEWLGRWSRDDGQPLLGLVIDLQHNLGGELQAAVNIADGLLEEGLIVNTDGRNPAIRMAFHARPGQWLPGVPLAVLVDEQTASSSEVLAAALQDHGRARIVGRPTYGKGIVQSVVQLRNGSALRLTTARYFTPSGRSLQGTGIAPDITADSEAEARQAALDWLKRQSR